MAKSQHPQESLFLQAEQFAREYNLFPSADPDAQFQVKGLLSAKAIHAELRKRHELDIDSYIEVAVSPAEAPDRETARDVVDLIGRIKREKSDGPYYEAIVEMDFGTDGRSIGVIAQDRTVRNGEWQPEHHLAAAKFAREIGKERIPIVTFMDTLGAAGDEIANRNNQAHSISRLIAVMSDLDVPNIGIIYGIGYSGGAIPLAASNMILSLRDGVFSTIQPRSLASIARRLNLSWQECAKHIGISAMELLEQGNIDGIIDYVPGEYDKLPNLRQAIVTGITSVEQSVEHFVAENPNFVTHYAGSVRRYLRASDRLREIESIGDFVEAANPTEYISVFGEAYRYLRYLRVRRRIKATTVYQYGRLTDSKLPEGELAQRTDSDRRRTFLQWIQDPDKIVYENDLKRCWSTFTARLNERNEPVSQLQRFLRVDRERNYVEAKQDVLHRVGMYLYNRWKTAASNNLDLLGSLLANVEDYKQVLLPSQITQPTALLRALSGDEQLQSIARRSFSHEGRKLLLRSKKQIDALNIPQMQAQLSTELNLSITGPLLGENEESTTSTIQSNRQILDRVIGEQFGPSGIASDYDSLQSITVSDVLLHPNLQTEFAEEVENFRFFDAMYDKLVENMNSIAEEAQKKQALSESTVRLLFWKLFKEIYASVTNRTTGNDNQISKRQREFEEWFLSLVSTRGSRQFFRTVEEWKKLQFVQLSDTLLSIVTYLLEDTYVGFIKAKTQNYSFNGEIAPYNIGRKRDFWNRLGIAYRDLRLQDKLNEYKRRRLTQSKAFIDRFFDGFTEIYSEHISSDPCVFPGFRQSIESSLRENATACGVITGIGYFNYGDGSERVGTLISNSTFQAGAFDMASAEKFCRLMVQCAEESLPIICFVSSGGMQTKEGAGALFSMAAVNDRITHFVREFDLPLVVFGFGDCTGGAQASFVTHPLVHTYYFSGTSMPFAGQIVIQSNLPLESIVANYLAQVPNSMQGLVKHPFHEGMDEELREIDPDIPIPEITVEDVVSQVLRGQIRQEGSVPTFASYGYDESELYRPVEKVLVHARGCAATKIVKIAKQNDIRVVLVQSDPDEDSVAAGLLDRRDRLISLGGSTPDESYLNAHSVLAVARNEGVDAIHPGIGFLSESSAFAELMRSRGINFIGPPVSSMETMGNKSNAISTAMSMDVPVVPGSHGIVTEVDDAAEIAAQCGYPVLIKAVHGGGGKGIQVVKDAHEFLELFQRVSLEAKAAFGNGDVYIEKFVQSLRHIEAQILRDRHGQCLVLGIRDCSVQRNKQKIFEESGSTMLPQELLDEVLRYSSSIADAVGYVGAGTVEFIYDLENESVYFMEMNTRLQVEHPVTELVSGIDIVTEQFRIAGNESIEDLEIQDNGYAIEARVNAEQLVRSAEGDMTFESSAGFISHCVIPEQKDIEIISTAAENKEISPYYDSMIMQVIAHGDNRDDTIDKLYEYLGSIEIRGIYTNIPVLRRILRDDIFKDGIYDTNFLDGFFDRIDNEELMQEIRLASGISDSSLDTEAIQIEDSAELKVIARRTGVFYLKPTPSEPDYVNVDSEITVDDVLCQLEAFKVFSPLRLRDYNVNSQVLYPDEKGYQIKRINVATGQQVNTGDLLFIVEPK